MCVYVYICIFPINHSNNKRIISKLKLHKITAGVYSKNMASIRVLEKNKFQREGIRLKQYLFNKERIDGFIYGKFS